MGFWDVVETAANYSTLGAYDALTADGTDGPIKNPKIDKGAFERGGQGADATEQGYNQVATNYRAAGVDGLERGQNQANATRVTGAQGQATGMNRAADQHAIGQSQQATQQGQANALAAQGQAAHGRGGPGYDTTVQDQARSQQYDALGGVRQQAATGADTSSFQSFYKGPEGPSAAESMMLGARDKAMGDALALSRSGRAGFNPAAERQALFQNAATAAETNRDLSTLRAQEAATARGQNLQAMTAEQQAIDAARRNQLAALGLEQQSLAGIGAAGAADARAEADIALAGRAQNDALALGYQGAAQNANALGVQAGLGYEGLANQSVAQGQDFNVAMQNAATGQEGLGVQQYLGAGQLGLGYQGLAEQVQQQERDAAMQYEALASGQNLAVQNANVQSDAQRDAAWMGMAGGLAGGAMTAMSDERSKKKIAELETTLGAYRALLDERHSEYPVDRASETADALDAHRGAGGYSYEYKDPNAPGAAPGRNSGPMSRELRSMPGVVRQGVDGMDRIDTGRLALNNTSALGETVRRDDEQDRKLAHIAEALGMDRERRESEFDPYGVEFGARNRYGDRAGSSRWLEARR